MSHPRGVWSGREENTAAEAAEAGGGQTRQSLNGHSEGICGAGEGRGAHRRALRSQVVHGSDAAGQIRGQAEDAQVAQVNCGPGKR